MNLSNGKQLGTIRCWLATLQVGVISTQEWASWAAINREVCLARIVDSLLGAPPPQPAPGIAAVNIVHLLALSFAAAAECDCCWVDSLPAAQQQPNGVAAVSILPRRGNAPSLDSCIRVCLTETVEFLLAARRYLFAAEPGCIWPEMITISRRSLRYKGS